jgi:hypothetical protein
LINTLGVNDSIANILTAVSNVGYHSQTLGIDQNGRIFIHDTALEPRIAYSPNLVYNSILECILYTRI